MASSSSSDHSSSITKRNLFDPEVRTVCAERHRERWLFSRHYMFVEDLTFFYLFQSGLMDKLVKVFRDADRRKKQISDQVNGQKRSLEDDNNEEVEGSSSTDVPSTVKKIKRVNIVMADASTQTEYSF